jgi:hypothetical protein
MRARILAAALAAGLAGLAPVAPSQAPADPHAEVRGMTVSCPTWGREWGSDAMVETMARLKGLGVNWVAIHPYAGIRADGTVVMSQRWYAETSWLTRPIEEAHRLGLKILINPHLAHWGSPFSWRGAIAFDADEEWQRFFTSYQDWISHLASICRDADGFCVGSELDATVAHEARWRSIIAAVRAQVPAPLTYAANWDAYERVSFWDALDVIGVQAYFPLVNHESMPTEEELSAAWESILDRLEDAARVHNRKVLLSELGYNRSAAAARQPWAYQQGGAGAEEVQRRCLRAALSALGRERRRGVVGAFLWKWFPGEVERGNFLMSTPPMRELIGAAWGPRGG